MCFKELCKISIDGIIKQKVVIVFVMPRSFHSDNTLIFERLHHFLLIDDFISLFSL